MIENIEIDIIVPINFPDRYKNAIIRVASLCAVKKHLDKPPKINIKMLKKIE